MEEFLAEIDNLRIIPAKQLEKGGTGIHRGLGKGTSQDFYGHMPYTPGDDIRKVDWRAYARTDSLYVREFTEERQMKINIFLDSSASMDFGTPNKWQFANMLAVGIGYIALKQWDKVDFYILNDKVEAVSKGLTGMEGFFELKRKTEIFKPCGKTSIVSICDMDIQCEGFTVILSDFLSKDIEKTLDYLRAKRQEVVIIHAISPWELYPVHGEHYKLVDSESGRIVRVRFSKQLVNKYIGRMREFLSKMDYWCTSRKIKYVLAPTDDIPSRVLRKALGVEW